jgi:hypothetical protein
LLLGCGQTPFGAIGQHCAGRFTDPGAHLKCAGSAGVEAEGSRLWVSARNRFVSWARGMAGGAAKALGTDYRVRSSQKIPAQRRRSM